MLLYSYRSIRNLFAFVVMLCVFCRFVDAEIPAFDYPLIDRIGSQMGQSSLVDVDRDGDLDWITGCNNGTIWWFEYKAPSDWVRHTLGQNVLTDVGGTAFDLDGDGWIDQVSGGTWYRNTGKPREQEFVRYLNGMMEKSHNNVAADMGGGGRVGGV